MDRISAMLNTFNGGEKLKRCLESVAWADEIVVIDSGSRDGSQELAKKFTDKVYDNKWPGYKAQREFGMERCSGEWILILDQDEYVTPELRDKLKEIAANSEQHRRYNAVWIHRLEHFWGKRIRYGNYNPSYQPRMAWRGKCTWTGSAHTFLVVEGGEDAILRVHDGLWHDAYNTPNDYFSKINYYSEFDAKDRLEQGRRPGLWHVMLSPLGMWWKCYVVHRGFRDGGHGLMNATAMAVYWFFRLSKVWHARWLEKNKKDTWEDYLKGSELHTESRKP
ncbi:MAG: glycosyltransferase family 2 protein [Candidatus Edwardsbacteria bacterium]|nr:glycosyltransferase family 2 protein [Candidatus Edwardsbacteria bacterium]